MQGEIKKLAAKCPYNFECSTNHKWETCSIESYLSEKLLTIGIKKNKSACPYCISYGNGYYCSCPVRIEIYQRQTR